MEKGASCLSPLAPHTFPLQVDPQTSTRQSVRVDLSRSIRLARARAAGGTACRLLHLGAIVRSALPLARNRFTSKAS
eukprot:3131564-Rhodomonas_salina.1